MTSLTEHDRVLDLPLQKLTAVHFTVDLPDIQAEKLYIISVEKCDADEYDTWNYRLGGQFNSALYMKNSVSVISQLC